MAEPDHPRPAVIAALMSLDRASPERLGLVLRELDPLEAWRRIADGSLDGDLVTADLGAAWRAEVASIDLAALDTTLRRLALTPTCWHDAAHPRELTSDIDAAPVVVRAGRPCPDTPRVGIVGTRRCTPLGKELAFELGAQLAEAGVSVVSGLALGIDGAAHRGALRASGAPPVAVVGSGADVVYPRRHRELWADVVAAGTLLTEVPLGGPPEPWRFPARNRLIAALSDVLVVVESRAAGGSLLTVEQAIRRDVAVMAVPGSVRNGAAEGTNQLLADGCAPVRDAGDVLVALGLREATAAARRRGERPVGAPPADPLLAAVWEAVDDGPTTVDIVVRRTGRPVPEVLAALDTLLADGYVATDGARFTRGARSALNPR